MYAGGGYQGGSEVAIPVLREPWIQSKHLRSRKWLLHSFTTRFAASLEPCGVRMKQNEFCVHVNMHEALCRHVKLNKQTDTNFLRVVTCYCGSQEALSL